MTAPAARPDPWRGGLADRLRQAGAAGGQVVLEMDAETALALAEDHEAARAYWDGSSFRYGPMRIMRADHKPGVSA